MSWRRRVCAVVLAAWLCPVLALARPGLNPDPATVTRLAAMPRWHALLHINPGATLRGVGESYVDDPAFFLAPNGADDPAAELRATWVALAPAGSKVRCRYPARYKFLAQQLGWQDAHPLAQCKKYQTWRARMPIGQLVLVFPAAYLNSPSSMFGHTLLRLDDSKNPESVYLSRAISFGAQTNGSDNSALYVWRGLAGGYPGSFSVVSYARKIHEYGFIENRDIWEYPLNLDHDELDWLVRHLWELRGVNFDYYFLDENCSFRLLELIKVARPSAPLLEGQRIAELPVNTVRELYAAGMIRGHRYRPSKVNVLNHLADQLSGAEQSLAQSLTRDPSVLDSPAFQNLAPARRHLVADVAYQAVRVRGRGQKRSEKNARISLALLRAVQRNPAPKIAPIIAPAPPESGHDTHLVSLAGGSLDGAAYGELGFRMTYHDVLDPPNGYLTGAGIEGFNLKLRGYQDGHVELEKLGLVSIRSIAPRSAFFKPISWFVDGGFAQEPVKHNRELGLHLQGGPGMSWQLGSLRPYAFVLGRAETVATEQPAFAIGAGADIGALWITPHIQLGLDLRQVYFVQHFDRRRVSLIAGVPVSQDNAVRASCDYQTWRSYGNTGCQLEWRHYF
ncbi:MAG: DUF4105 domain-containing protein [Salinisphaera sp.]|jgi:hypothetical protein|nr:DUF4105 domain-containing protein [Salinisphaera sp.]